VREGLSEYLNLGYVATDTGIHSASETLEYCSDDFAIAQFAKAIGNSSDYLTYLTRAQKWFNLFSSANGN
jgi:putative alpha-1,2-mannosidase